MRLLGRLSVLTALCLSAGLAAAGEELRLLPTFRYGTIADGVGQANLVPFDLDGDGRRELISCSNGVPFAVSARDDAYVTTWHGPTVACTGVAAGDRNLDGGADVIVVGGPKLMLLDPRSLSAPLVTVALPGNANATDVALGNVDDDAAPEIVVLTTSAAHVYDGATLELQWTATGYGGHTVRIGDVDGDARREIVVAGSTGYVLDGAAEVQKWGYIGGFNSLTLGNLDADAKDEIVFRSSSSQVSILHGDTSAVTTIPTDWFDTLAVGDANGDGANEIITGNNQWGDIEGRSPADGALLWDIYNPEHGTMAVGTAELDGDPTMEVFWGAGATSSGDDALFIGTAGKDAQPEWRCLDLDGPYHSAAGDLDGDGDVEYVVATYSSNSGYDGSLIEVFDVATGVSEGRLPFNESWYGVFAAAIGQLDGDAALEVAVLAGGVLYTWDGITRLPEFTSNTGGYSAIGSGDSLLLANLDGDSVDEVVVSSETQILILNGASNIIQKALPVSGYLVDFEVANLNGGASSELLVATSSGLTVYDTGSWAPIGSLAAMGIADTDATAADGGTVAVSFDSYYSSQLKLFKGAALTPAYECSGPFFGKVAFGQFGDGETRLLASREEGGIHVFPLSGASCPETTATFFTFWVHGMTFADVTGDGRNELLIDSYHGSSIALLGLASEVRGDVDGDEVVTLDDVDTAVDHLFGTGPGISPTADANADGRLGVEDVFVLIDHELGGGAPLQP